MIMVIIIMIIFDIKPFPPIQCSKALFTRYSGFLYYSQLSVNRTACIWQLKSFGFNRRKLY